MDLCQAQEKNEDGAVTLLLHSQISLVSSRFVYESFFHFFYFLLITQGTTLLFCCLICFRFCLKMVPGTYQLG